MFAVAVTCWFETKTEEQAEYIRKFFDDAQSLMACENSMFSSTGVHEIEGGVIRSASPGG